jgi:hypothetical protein
MFGPTPQKQKKNLMITSHFSPFLQSKQSGFERDCLARRWLSIKSIASIESIGLIESIAPIESIGLIESIESIEPICCHKNATPQL